MSADTITLQKKFDLFLHVVCFLIICFSIYVFVNYPDNINEYFGKAFYVMAMSPIVVFIQIYNIYKFFGDPKTIVITPDKFLIEFGRENFREGVIFEEIIVKKTGYRYKLTAYAKERDFSTGSSYICSDIGSLIEISSKHKHIMFLS